MSAGRAPGRRALLATLVLTAASLAGTAITNLAAPTPARAGTVPPAPGARRP